MIRSMFLLPALAGLAGGLAAAEIGVSEPGYVGSKACVACHGKQARAWEGSHHALAWLLPDDESVLGDFADATFEHKGVISRFSTRDGRYFVETDGPAGTLQEFEVKATAGVAPLQQYLLETEPGRLQASDLAWDTLERRWYHLYPEQDLQGGEGLHWTGPYKTWNARCAECHATGYRKNYDPKTHRYASSQAEIGVGCEACHGPGEAHVTWAKAPYAYDEARWPGLTASGFSIDFTAKAAESEIQLCAGCHSRREPLGDGSPLPGTAYHDAYRLALLREGLYHADGSIQDEVYVYGSFLQSKMYARGVRCSDCHDPHRAELRAEGNAVCAQCHSPAGNPRFPSLRPAAYDDPAHHFHAPGSEGAQCKNCHMIERVYMGIDSRRDHSFRVPRPDLTAETGAPDACTDCHAARESSWAAAEIARRFPDSTRRGTHFSQVFAAARVNPAETAGRLLQIASDQAQPGIVRATALGLLRPVADATVAGRTARFLGDPDPLLRAAAIPLQAGAPPAARGQRLSPLFEDPRRAVRIAAARTYLGTPIASLPLRYSDSAGEAMQEWRTSLLAKTDFPETHMAIAGSALVLRNPAAAEQAFREAARLDPQMVDAWIMVVRLRAAQGDAAGVRSALEEALFANPSDPSLSALRAQLDAAPLR